MRKWEKKVNIEEDNRRLEEDTKVLVVDTNSKDNTNKKIKGKKNLI